LQPRRKRRGRSSTHDVGTITARHDRNIKMRKTFTLSLTATLALAATGVTIATASSRGPGANRASDEVIHAVIHNTPGGETPLDLDHSGGSPPDTVGDQLVFSSDILIDGQRVGHDGGSCTVVRLQPALWSCLSTNQLRNGTITAHGLLDLTTKPPFHLAITGGTGAYRDAHGEVQVVFDTPDPDHDQVTFRIRH